MTTETELLHKIVDACNRWGVTQVPAGTKRPDLEALRVLLDEARRPPPSGAEQEEVSDEAVEAEAGELVTALRIEARRCSPPLGMSYYADLFQNAVELIGSLSSGLETVTRKRDEALGLLDDCTEAMTYEAEIRGDQDDEYTHPMRPVLARIAAAHSGETPK